MKHILTAIAVLVLIFVLNYIFIVLPLVDVVEKKYNIVPNSKILICELSLNELEPRPPTNLKLP